MDELIDPLTALAVAAGLGLVLAFLLWPNRGFIARWRRARRMSERVYREDALKHIHKAESKGRRPTLESIAGALGIGLNDAARLIDRMGADGLLRDEAGTPHLTPAGRDAALHVIRAHRLWERYLAEETGYEEADWHGQAEEREHELTPAELERLAVQLGNPTHDPHGDPIPARGGALETHGGVPLTALRPEETGRIVHLEDEPAIIYAQLVAEGLSPGQIVRHAAVSAERVHFWTNGDEHVLAPILAANIFVRPLPAEEAETTADSRPLTALQLGESGRVVALSTALRGQERRRLLDLGLLPGTEVTAELRSPGGDPTAYRIRGATIALRAEQARLVKVTHEAQGSRGAGEQGNCHS
jgi:DtxR family Mn-dependent transcriptional regulator